MSSDVAELERAKDVMPVDWREVAVADVVAMLPGFAFKSENFVTDTDAGLPLIRIRDLGQTDTATRYVGEYDEAFAVRDGDILVGMDGAFEAVRWRGGKALLNQRVLKLSSARQTAMDEGYLFYRVKPALAELEQTISGTTVKHLSTKDLRRLTWQLPPLDEQRRIAEVLRSVDEAISMNVAVAAQFSRAYQAALAELIGSAPDHWETVRLSQIAELTLGKMLDKEKNKGELRPYLANINVRWGAFDFRDLRNMRFEQRELDRYGLCHGDIVMCEGGEPGRCALWTDEKPGLMIQKALHRIRPNERVDNHYLYYALVHSVRSGACDEYMTGSGIKHLPGNQLAKIEVSLPSLDEQQRIAETLRLLKQAAAATQNALELARQIKSKLMSDLLFGHVRVPA